MKPTPSPSGARITALALRHAVPMNLLFVVLVVAGGIVVRNMPVDVYPDVSLDEATIETLWLGAPAEDVEKMVTDRIEDKIQDIPGIARVVSDSKPDASLIRVKFRESLSDVELDAAFRQLRAAVEQVVDLPQDAEKPVVTKISVGEIFFLLWVAIEDTGGVGEEVLHDVAFRLKPVLRDLPGVAKVDDKLIRNREVHIRADRRALRKHNLTMQDIGVILRQYNRNLPSGTLVQTGHEISVRAEGGVTNPDELGSIVVLKSSNGGHVYLRDVAVIETGFARKTFFARYNLNGCLPLGITKTHQADSREVARRVRQVVSSFEAALPAGVELHICDDTSDIIRSRLRVLTTNLAGGVALVFLVLWVAVGLRNSVLAIIGIPFSFACALIGMHALGVTINAVSLIGLVLCAGMIVDDAIVVLENIYRHIQQQEGSGQGRARLYDSIIEGAGEVFWPVVSSSATTVAAFLPLLIMTGVTGEFFSIIPKTVTVVLMASLVECLLILPVHYLDFGFRARTPRVTEPGIGLQAGKALAGRLHRWYGQALNVALHHRYLVPLPLAALAFVALGALPLIHVELFPSEFQICLVDLQTADEASLDQTGAVVKPIEELALDMGDRVSGLLTSFGLMVTEDNAVKLRNNLAQIHVQLAHDKRGGTDTSSVAIDLQERIEAYVAAHPDCGLRSFRVWAPRSGPAVGKPVSIRIDCPEFKVANRLAERYQARLHAMEGVFGIRDNLEFGRQQINLIMDDDRGSVHGLTFMTLASVLRTANEGLIVSSFKDTESGEDLDVRLMLDSRYRHDVMDLLDLDVRCAKGYVLQLNQVADIGVTQGYAGIPHYNGKRAVTITAELDTNTTSVRKVHQQLRREFEEELSALPNVRVTYGGQFAETLSSFASLREAFAIALVIIYFLLATQFRSYAQPLVILLAVPFAGIGVIGGLLAGGDSFTTMTFIAIVGMSGVVVNDSILLVDCANQRMRSGLGVFDALRAAGGQRVKPILMTTITTCLGLAPLALGLGGKSRIWSPFASSFVWGLTFATLITLFVVPAGFYIIHDAREWVRRLRGAPHPDEGILSGEETVEFTG
ncbi:MAG: efflux RND transporter permease subunit [Phycisphaerae bacterium]